MNDKKKNMESLQEASIWKASHIHEILRSRPDIAAKKAIQESTLDLDFSNFEKLMISKHAYDYVKSRDIPISSVFAHPRLLQEIPYTSLYYRGLSGLSIKSVKQQTKLDVRKNEERKEPFKKIDFEKAKKLACLYNMVISAVITNSTEWTLDNGYRSVIATLGITIDGQMRNKVGRIAADRVRKVIFEYMKESALISPDAADNAVLVLQNEKPVKEVRFGAEPDVGFYDAQNKPLAIIEIKGGLDTAGALERLGAVGKTAQKAKEEYPQCKVFLIVGVTTPEMEKRLYEYQHIEGHFNLFDIVRDEKKQKDFLREIFHHALRLVA